MCYLGLRSKTIFRKLVCTKSQPSRCIANILLHRQLFETCVETLLITMLKFGESPSCRPCLYCTTVPSVILGMKGNPLNYLLSQTMLESEALCPTPVAIITLFKQHKLPKNRLRPTVERTLRLGCRRRRRRRSYW
jgi:hypothetical protein